MNNKWEDCVMITIVMWVNSFELDYAGKSVEEASRLLKPILNHPPDCKTEVNGEPVTGKYILQEGDGLEFLDPRILAMREEKEESADVLTKQITMSFSTLNCVTPKVELVQGTAPKQWTVSISY